MLEPYFEAHPVAVPTSYPLRQVFQKPEVSNRLIKWSVELGLYGILYQPQTSMKAYAVANFVAKFTKYKGEEIKVPETEGE